MKLILPLLFALSAVAQTNFSTLEWNADFYSPTTASRYYEASNATFRVDYYYTKAHSWVPAVYGATPHHDATVTVFQNGAQIGKPISGATYAPGCKMCDDPARYVLMALQDDETTRGQKPEFVVTNIPPHRVHLITNQINPTIWYVTNGPMAMATTNFGIWTSIQPFDTFTNGVVTTYGESQGTGELRMHNPNAPIHWLRLNVEIGFRPDGTVIWRATK